MTRRVSRLIAARTVLTISLAALLAGCAEQSPSGSDSQATAEVAATDTGHASDVSKDSAHVDTASPVTGELGDNMTPLDFIGNPVETVGMALVDGFIVTCGGFGLDTIKLNLTDGSLSQAGSGLQRCQNVAQGPLGDNGRVIFAAHHGDAYVPVSAVHTLVLDPNGTVGVAGPAFTEPGTSFEGLAYDPETSTLYVAAHTRGIYRFSVASDGQLTALSPLAAKDTKNAYRLALHGAHLLVADGEGGLKVVDKMSGAVMGGAATVGFAKDVVVTPAGIALVAVSSLGVQAFDLTEPGSPTLITTVFTWGSTNTLELFAAGTRAVVSNWRDMTVLDVSSAQSLRVLGVDRALTLTNKDPRILTVATDGHDMVIAGDWLGIASMRWHEGLIGPEFDTDRNDLTVANVAPGESANANVEILNRGHAPLVVSAASSAHPAWTVAPVSFVVEPGRSQNVVATYNAPAQPDGGATSKLGFVTDDPDEPTPSIRLRGNVSASLLGVGDALTSDFDFLDVDSPDGNRDIANLKGHVVVLAYFATF